MSFNIGDEVYYCKYLLSRGMININDIKKGNIECIAKSDIYTDKNVYIRTESIFKIVTNDSIDTVTQSEIKKIFTPCEMKDILAKFIIEKQKQFDIEIKNINDFIEKI